MPTNLHIDEKLLAKALEIGGKKTKRDTVHEALEEYVLRREQLKILDLAGKIDFDPKYDHKADRRRGMLRSQGRSRQR